MLRMSYEAQFSIDGALNRKGQRRRKEFGEKQLN